MSHYPLTEEQIEFYQQNGYAQLLDVLTAEELENVRQAVDEAMTKRLEKAFDRVGHNPEYDKVFHQKVNLWREHEGIKRFTFSPKLAEIARRLARAQRIRLWHDHALVKMPGDSKPSPWHQDLPYWPMNEAGALSCWMALDDVDEHNGCMAFIPGSHRVGRLDPINLVNPQDIFGFEASGPLKDAQPAVMKMKAGSCTFHNGLTFHYAFPNATDRPRRAMIVIYMPDGTTYSGKRHICTDGLNLEVGKPLTGELFPLLA